MTSKYLLFALFHFSVSYGSTRTFWSRRSHTCKSLCICICLFRFADHHVKLSLQATGFMLMVVMLPMLTRPLLRGIVNTTVVCQKKIKISNNGNRWLHLLYQTENTTYGLDLSQDWTTLALTWSKPRGRQIQLHLIVNRCGMTARTTLSPALVALGILSHPLQQAIRLHLNLFGDSARMVKRWCLAWSSWSGLYYTISKWHSPFSRWSVRKRLEGTQRGRSEKTNVF